MTEQDLSSVHVSHKTEKLLCKGELNQGRLKEEKESQRKKDTKWWGIDGEIREREKARKGISLKVKVGRKSGVCWVFPSLME